ncbi:hypothetical protein C6568_16065 [Melaminivora suipulveris]|uniref:Type III secretion system chaperone n=2 Tax=Melaminivora suipulveris TaxID=2109913 RepID=A0A2R3QFQ1_9BURK|nr:hypothetical protein C6568_16065 [Melaminivora suipulveris]
MSRWRAGAAYHRRRPFRLPPLRVPPSMSDADASALISALGESIGIPGLRLDAQGCCRLLFDGDQIVELHPAPAQGRWVIACTLHGRRPEGEFVRALLEGNHMGAGFGGGWAGLDDQGRAVLHLPLAWAEASAAALLQAIELVLQHAERWQQRMADHRAAVSQTSRMMDWAQRI